MDRLHDTLMAINWSKVGFLKLNLFCYLLLNDDIVTNLYCQYLSPLHLELLRIYIECFLFSDVEPEKNVNNVMFVVSVLEP